MNTNTNILPKTSTYAAIQDLNANDLFMLPGSHTVYKCERRHTTSSGTTVWYTIPTAPEVGEYVFSRVNLSSCYIVD